MANPGGQTPNHLIEQLAKSPFSFDFFRAVRLLQSVYPDHPCIGYSLSPAQDPVRFCQSPSLAFAPSTLEQVQQTTGEIPKLFVNFLGLFGPHAPMPLHITEYARERQRHFNDDTIVGFFNLFHHRLLSFFFRAWSANQKALDLDRADEQRYAVYLGSLFGIGMESLRERDSDWAKLYFTGRLACQTRNAEGLEAILEQYFEIKTEIQTFVGRWMDLPADSLCKLGESPQTGSVGLTTILGSHIWDCQLNFRIKLGPMKRVDYERMLPHGDAFKRLKYWVLNYCGEHFIWDIQLVLLADEVPEVSLGKAGRLGWTTWLKTKPFTEDAADLILNPPAE
jgi:type VI secretion system protein ImpH